jgi:hypothetical protein
MSRRFIVFILPVPDRGGGEEVFRVARLPFTKLYLPSPSLNGPKESYSGLIPKGAVVAVLNDV